MTVVKQTEDYSESGSEIDLSWCSGNSADFEPLVIRYKDRIYSVVYRILGNHEDAQDVAQEVFVRAYRSMETFQGHAQVYTWLFSIAMNLCRNELRNRGRKGRNKGVSLESLQDMAPAIANNAIQNLETPRNTLERQELDDAITNCLNALPEHYKLPFVLRIVDGQRYQEIANAIGCPEGTVKSRLNQARSRLKDCLQERGVI